MTVTITLNPEVEAGFLAQAEARGMTVEAYLQAMIDESSAAPPSAESAQTDRLQAVRKMIEFGEKYRLSLGEPITRALLHEGHRY